MEKRKHETYEEVLFEKGTLNFNLREFLETTTSEILKLTRKLRQSGLPQTHNETFTQIDDLVDDLAHKMRIIPWLLANSGRVPDRWRLWYNIIEDLKTANEFQQELSPYLINAAISHPHELVAIIAGKYQVLSYEQLVYLTSRKDIDPQQIGEIFEAQLGYGVREETIVAVVKDPLIKNRCHELQFVLGVLEPTLNIRR